MPWLSDHEYSVVKTIMFVGGMLAGIGAVAIVVVLLVIADIKYGIFPY